MERKTRPVSYGAVLGAPDQCPTCGGYLQPAFGAIEKNGIRMPVLDPTTKICRDCGALTKVALDTGEGGR